MDTILMQVDVEAILAVIAGILVGVSITWIVVWVINKAKNKTFHEDIDRQLEIGRASCRERVYVLV